MVSDETRTKYKPAVVGCPRLSLAIPIDYIDTSQRHSFNNLLTTRPCEL